MEEQNKNIENQQPENENNETNIQTKKPVPKKTIIIASIIAAITILATVMCVIIFGGGEKQEIIGEWRNAYNANEYIKFFEDGTGEFQVENRKLDFNWVYDLEKEAYTTTVAGKDFAFRLKTEEGITFLTGYGYLFKPEDCITARSIAPRLRDNRIDQELKDKEPLPLSTPILAEKATIVFNEIYLSEDKKTVIANISITAKENISSSELNTIMTRGKSYYFDYQEQLTFYSSSSLGTSPAPLSLFNKSLNTGDVLTTEIEMINDYNVSQSIKNLGQYYGFLTLLCDGSTYYLDFRNYTKQ